MKRSSLQILKRMLLVPAVLFSLLSVAAIKTVGAPPLPIFFFWSLSEFQPNISQGGRANTFAVNPTNNSVILVASETGGLFRSTNGGSTWRHVDSLPCFALNGVVFFPANPNVVLVTARDDFRVAGGGGVWRSTDGGGTWTQSTAPSGISGRLSAYEISVEPGSYAVYVASEFGVLKSTNQGATWVFQDVYGSSRPVYSVAALGDNRVLAGGPDGVRRSADGGATWLVPTTPINGIWDIHAFGRSPVSGLHAYVGSSPNWDSNLFYTEDGGDHWTQITSAPMGGDACGGIIFVKATPRRISRLIVGVNLYWGNRCGVSRLIVPRNLLTRRMDYSGTWQNLNVDHGDTRDLAFNNSNSPVLLGTDGGIHRTTDGGANWIFVGGGNAGYNALQITEIKGQRVSDIGRTDLYFGTQDNNLWSSGDNGVTWTNPICCEGFFIEAQRTVNTSANSKVTGVTCGACFNFVTNPLFTGLAGWSNPSGDVAGNPMIVRQTMHLQRVVDSGGFARGLAVSNNLGSTWQQFATFPEDTRDIPKLGRPGNFLRSMVVYQPIRTGWDALRDFEINHLARIIRRPSGSVSVFYPAMNNFGGLGINPTMFAWYQIYGVDPGNAYHLIAPDVVNERMMESRDGGENWAEISGFTNLVTDGGRLRFRNSIFPVATAIGFSPQDSNLVLIGSAQGGLYFSDDNGANWSRVSGSQGVTYATSVHWRTANEAIISTYGRGLWRLQGRLYIPRPDFEKWCRLPCIIRPFDRNLPDPPPFERAILVYDGRIQGIRVERGVLHELFVSPGSSVVFAAERGEMKDLRITETSKPVGMRGLRIAAIQEPKIMKGIVLNKAYQPVGMVYGEKEEPFSVGEDETQDKEGSTKSPIAGKPRVQIVTNRFEGAPVVTSGEFLQLTGTGFPAGAKVEIAIDGRAERYQFRVDEKGVLRAEIRAPVGEGLHRLVIMLDGKVIDGSMFLVKHNDRRKR